MVERPVPILESVARMGLLDRLRQRICREGSIALADYITCCLLDAEEGYYATKEPFGVDGDFVTAPEITSLFGHMLGLWILDYRRRLGDTRRVAVVELGPGSGVLMRDALTVIEKLAPGFAATTPVHLIEAAAAAEQCQRVCLSDFGGTIDWHRSVGAFLDRQDADPTALIIIANEFFDALPIDQWQWDGWAWCERRVGLDQQGSLCWVLTENEGDQTALLRRASGEVLAVDTICEIGGERNKIGACLATHLSLYGGAGLIIDYGTQWPAYGDSLQGVYRHQHRAVLCDPGSVDITAHVDFHALAEAIRGAGCETTPIIPQGLFLRALGLDLLVDQQARRAPHHHHQGAEAARRLTAMNHHRAMGQLFKAMAFYHPDDPLPAPWFEASA